MIPPETLDALDRLAEAATRHGDTWTGLDDTPCMPTSVADRTFGSPAHRLIAALDPATVRALVAMAREAALWKSRVEEIEYVLYKRVARAPSDGLLDAILWLIERKEELDQDASYQASIARDWLGRAEAAERTSDTLRAERDRLAALNASAVDETWALGDRVTALAAALERYGEHEGECLRYRIVGEPGEDEPCTCGYQAARTPTPEAT